MSSIAVEETEVLRIIRDFLEEGGHAECLRTLEKNTGAGPQGLPSELQFVRELVLSGQWKELMKFLQPLSGLGKSEDFTRCSYVVVKQQYLENLAKGSNGDSETTGSSADEAELKKRENLRLQLIMANLQRLEQLCPTKEDYSNLCYLLTLPSLTAHSKYRNWDVHSARLSCFYFIANWVAKVLYPHTVIKLPADSAKKGLSSNRMVQLLAKGLLYEECETVCAQRCGDREARPKILDLCGWMQQQPDSAFQLSPSRLSLVIVPHSSQGQTATCSSELLESGKSPHRMLQLSKSMMENFKSLPHPAVRRVVHNQTLLSRSAPDLKVVDLTSETNTDGDGREEERPANEEEEEKRSEKEMERVNEKEVAVQKSQQTGGIPTQAAVDHKPHTQLTRQEARAATKKKEAKPRKSNASEKTTVEAEHADSHIASHQVITVNPVQDSTSRQHDAIEIKHHTEPASSKTQIYVPPTEDVSVQAQQREPQVPARPLAELEVYGQPHPPAVQTVEQFEDNFNPMPPTTPFQTTPLIHRSKGGRNSSTPKPSGYHLCPSQSSPSTSPVPYVPGTHGLIDSPSRFGKKSTQGFTECPLERPVGRYPNRDGLSSSSEQSSARKHIDFGADSSQWPTATLISTITDPQVVRSVAFSQSGEVVAVGANSKTLRLCSSLPLTHHGAAGLDELPMLFHHPRYHRGSIYCLGWWGDSLLASGSNDQNIKLLSHSPSQCIPRGHLSVHNGTVRDLVFLPSGELVSGGAGNPALMISDCNTGKLIGSHEGHLDQILAVAVVDETTIASSSQDKTVRLWDTRQQRAFHTLVLTHPVTSLSTHSNHNHLATAHLDGSCSIHDMRTLKTLSTIQPHSNECRSVRYSSDGHWLLTGSYDGNVCLVNVESLEWKRIVQHGDKVIQCRWHTAGQVIASTGADKKACFWALQY